MITLIWRSDVHLADVSPQSRTDDWAATVLGKIAQIGTLAQEVQADGVLDGGDFFHLKSPSRNSHELVSRAAQAHATYPCPIYATVGNHDVKYGSLEFLPESPLAVLFDSGMFQRLYDQHEAVFEKDGIKVRVVGVPYHGTKYDWNRFTTIVKGSEDWLVVVAHCLASPVGGTLFEAEDILKYGDLVNLNADVFCLGHWHKDQGVTKIAPKKWVVNVGSVSRGSISQDDLNRTPSCCILHFDKDTVEISKVSLDIRPASEVFDLVRHTKSETRQISMDAMVDRLQASLVMREGESLLDQVRELDLPDAVRERALFYLEQAGAK